MTRDRRRPLAGHVLGHAHRRAVGARRAQGGGRRLGGEAARPRSGRRAGVRRRAERQRDAGGGGVGGGDGQRAPRRGRHRRRADAPRTTTTAWPSCSNDCSAYPPIHARKASRRHAARASPTAPPASTSRPRSGRAWPPRPLPSRSTASCGPASAGARRRHVRDRARRRRGGPAGAAPLDGARAGRGRAARVPGRQGHDRPADRQRLLLRLPVRRAHHARPTSSASRTRCGASSRREHAFTRDEVDRDDARARFVEEGEPFKVELIDDLPDGRDDHALHAGRLHRPLPRAAPADDGADQGLQAASLAGVVLARRREARAADARLRHRVLHAGGARRAPAPDRGGARAATTGASARSSTSSVPRGVAGDRRSGTRTGGCVWNSCRPLARARTAAAATAR